MALPLGIGAGVAVADVPAQGRPQGGDAGDGGLAGALLGLEEDLGDQGPGGDGRGVDGVGVVAEVDAVLGEGLSEALVIECLGEWEVL